MKVKMWDPLNSEEADAKEVELDEWASFSISSHNLETAVRKFVEKRWDANDYPVTTEVNVRGPDGAGLLEFTVHTEETVVFRARPREKP